MRTSPARRTWIVSGGRRLTLSQHSAPSRARPGG
ncbi:hypothetical protein GB937_010929 [Aspergillus fischeri]|nr:hypothetical protein GB937_010929 [Aspergillus fischeri]